MAKSNSFAMRRVARLSAVKDFAVSKLLKFTGTQRYLTIQLDITNACNLRCVHCYHPHHRNEGAISFEQWKTILDQYDALLSKLRLLPAVTICGGEPMASPMLAPMLREVSARWPDVPICILTNGTVLRADLIPLFRQLNVDFQVSMDGPDTSRHDEIRGVGSFERTIRGIKTYSDAGLDVHLLAVLSQKSSPWISDFFELASSLGVSSMNFTRFIPEGSGLNLVSTGGDEPLSLKELKIAFEQILDCSRRTLIATDTNQPLFNLIDPALGAHGMLGYQGLIVDFRGGLKLSSRGNFVLGNILKEGLETLFLEHPLMRALRNGEIEVCGQCHFFARCGGYRTAAYAASGNFLGPDPACWYLGEREQERKEA